MKERRIAFAMLDSSYEIPQHLQMLSFKNYCNYNFLEISFYGGELVGEEEKHLLLKEYLKASIYNNFLFFTIRQFIDRDNIFQQEILSNAIETGKIFHFANEAQVIRSQKDVDKMRLIAMSVNN